MWPTPLNVLIHYFMDVESLLRNIVVCGIIDVKLLLLNYCCGIIAVELLQWNYFCGIIAVESLLWNHCCEIIALAGIITAQTLFAVESLLGNRSLLWNH